MTPLYELQLSGGEYLSRFISFAACKDWNYWYTATVLNKEFHTEPFKAISSFQAEMPLRFFLLNCSETLLTTLHWICMHVLCMDFSYIEGKVSKFPSYWLMHGIMCTSYCWFIITNEAKPSFLFFSTDIKPENLLISKSGILKLCDFGKLKVSEVSACGTFSACNWLIWHYSHQLFQGLPEICTKTPRLTTQTTWPLGGTAPQSSCLG